MDQAPLETFLPNTGDLQSTLLLSGLLALMGITFSILLLLKPSRGVARNYRMLGAMLLFFVFLIGASTAFFTWLNKMKTGPVSLYPDAIEIGKDIVPFSEIRNATLEMAGRRTVLEPGQVRNAKRILLIEDKSGKVYALSEDHYPVDAILRRLREQVRSWEKERE